MRPALPNPDAQGYRPAVPALRAAMAQKIIRRRTAVGLSQQDLAKRAGIRVKRFRAWNPVSTRHSARPF